jgi:hypothetical protein
VRCWLRSRAKRHALAGALMAMVSLMAMSVHRTRRRPSRGPRGGATPGACRTPDRRRTTRRRGAPTSSPAGRRTNVGSVASFDRSRRHRATSRAPLTAPASWRQAFRQHGPTSASKRFRATDGPHQQSEPGRARPLDAGPAPGHQVRRLQAARFASRGSWVRIPSSPPTIVSTHLFRRSCPGQHHPPAPRRAIRSRVLTSPRSSRRPRS